MDIVSTIANTLISLLQKAVTTAPAALNVAEAITPSLAKSVTLTEVLAGFKAASGLNFTGIEKAVSEHFANVQDDLSTVEDIAKAVAPFFPPAMYVDDAAMLISMLVTIGGVIPADWNPIQVNHGPTKPVFGPDTPENESYWDKTLTPAAKSVTTAKPPVKTPVKPKRK